MSPFCIEKCGSTSNCLLDNKLLVLEKPPPDHNERSNITQVSCISNREQQLDKLLSLNPWEGPVSSV